MFLNYLEIYTDHLAFKNCRKENLLNCTAFSLAKAGKCPILFYSGNLQGELFKLFKINISFSKD